MSMELIAPVPINLEIMELANTVRRKAGFSSLSWSALADKDALARFNQDLAGSLDDVVKQVLAQVTNPAEGIAVVDIPSLSSVDQATDMWLGSAIALLLSKKLYSPRIDESTGLPFTIYNASPSGEQALKAKGIKYFSPEKNLGFHTDGIVHDGTLWAPRIVSIYNVFFGYKKPGTFYWVPFSRWSDCAAWADRIGDRTFKLEITPITYRSSDGVLNVRSQGAFDVRLFVSYENDLVPFFNGEILSCINDEQFDIALVKEMLISVGTRSTRLTVPLKARRLFLLNNWFGAHARDVFEEPIGKDTYTRSFFRLMDETMLSFGAS